MGGSVAVNPEINRPDVLAEVKALIRDYDRALMANDVSVLEGYFWPSAHALRYGVTEELYGAEEISAFRKARVVNFADRKTLRETILTLGDTLAIANVEFSLTVSGGLRHGRQSQVWVKFPDLGWRIVSAHVSHRVTPAIATAFGAAPAYGPAAAQLLGLMLDPTHLPGVVHDLDVMAKVVAPLMAFDLPDEEPAPVFAP